MPANTGARPRQSGSVTLMTAEIEDQEADPAARVDELIGERCNRRVQQADAWS